MNKKILLLSGIVLCAITAAVIIFVSPTKPIAPLNPEEPKSNIGFLEQWKMMKTNGGGEIPRGLKQKWFDADQKNASLKRSLSNPIATLDFIGPSNVGGRTRDLLIDQSDDKRLLACAVTGGLWESKDGGYNWKAHNDLSSSLIVTSITQNPYNSKEIYYGTGEVVGSADVSGEGVFKSSDGGLTFSQLQSTLDLKFGNIWDVEHSISDSKTLYVSVESKGLYKSTNSGDDFSLVYDIPQHVHDIEVFADGSVMIAVQSRGIFFSKNGDLDTWTELTKGLPSKGFYRIELSYSPKFPKVVYAHFTQGVNTYTGTSVGVWKSSNSGKSWTEMGNPSDGGGQFAQPYYTLGFQVDPNDTNFLVAGGTNLVYSQNGGVTWSRGRASHADYHAFIFHPNKNGIFYACNDGGIYEYNKTTIRTRASDRNNGYNVTQYYAGSFTPDSIGVVGGTQDNGTHFHRWGNSAFSSVVGGDGAFCHISQQNPDLAYGSSQNGYIQKTTRATSSNGWYQNIMNELDGDNNWEIDDNVWFINPFEMNYLNGEELYFITKSRIWHSLNAGDSWRPISSFKSNLYCVGIPNETSPTKIYFGGQNMILQRIDNPANASPGDEVNLKNNLPTGISRDFIANIEVHPRNSSIIYLALSNIADEPRIWRVENADTESPTWVNVSGDLPSQLPCNWFETDPFQPDSVFFAATDFGIYTTSNGGKNWVKDERLPNVSVHQIRMRNTDRRLFIYTHGRGIWHADLKKIEDQYIGTPEVIQEQIAVYPNPTTATISITKAELSGVPFQIMDLQGKLVLEGKVSNQIDVSLLPEGSYLFRATQQEQVYTAQFIKR